MGNIDVLSVLLDSRDTYLNSRLTIGRWVGLSRRISALFKQYNVQPVLKGMETIDWGSGGSVSKLIDFRNRFAHGSFSPSELIEEHYTLLINLIEQVSGLYDQHWVGFIENKPFVWTGEKIHEYEPVINEANNSVWLSTDCGYVSMSPFFEVITTESQQYTIGLTNFSQLSVDEMFNISVLQAWQARYTGIEWRNQIAARLYNNEKFQRSLYCSKNNSVKIYKQI